VSEKFFAGGERGGDLGEPDGRFYGFKLTEKGANTGELVIALVIE